MVTALLNNTLDALESDAASGTVQTAIGRLVAELERVRRTTDAATWRRSCAETMAHPALDLLMEDPYSRDARRKPAGYAGDARTLDYVYLRTPGSQTMSPVGRALFDVTTGVPIAEAVRARSRRLGAEITRRATDGTTSIASIACGHARELDHVAGALPATTRYWGIDQDPASVAHCRARFGAHATFEVGAVRDIIAGRIRIPASDLVHASGLFDYLETRAATVLVKRMLAAVNVGGRITIPNLSAGNEEIAYMEAVMDWWMQYRSADDMRALGALAVGDDRRFQIRTFSTDAGRLSWLEIDRLA